MSSDFDLDTIEYKIILIGDSTVGKTSLVKKIIDNKFLPFNVSTIGIDQKSLLIDCELNDIKRTVSLTITDPSGQERYKAITRAFYRDIEGVILVYDLTVKTTFDSLEKWISEIKEFTNKAENEYMLFLLGTKSDLLEDQKSSFEDDIDKFCKKYNIDNLGECSCKNFSDEDFKSKLLNGIIQKLYKKIGIPKNNDDSKSIKLNAKKKKKKRAHCCGNKKN